MEQRLLHGKKNPISLALGRGGEGKMVDGEEEQHRPVCVCGVLHHPRSKNNKPDKSMQRNKKTMGSLCPTHNGWPTQQSPQNSILCTL